MLERLVNIHNKIKSGAYPSTSDLAEEFNGDRGRTATISRDIDMLRGRFGAPIVYDPKRSGYYYSEEYEMPIGSVGTSDFEALSSARVLLSAYRDTPFYNEISEVIDLLTLPNNSKNVSFINRIALPPNPKVKINEENWTRVVEALKENLIIEFDYNGIWNNDTTHRRVHPYQLLLDDGFCYVWGYSEERKALRIFNLNRMKNIVVTEDDFVLPDKYDFSEFTGGGKFGVFHGEKNYRFLIELYGYSREAIKDCKLAEDQEITEDEKKDMTLVSFHTTQAFKVREWVLSQGSNAIPLEPDWFVDEWKEEVKAMMKNCRM